MHEITIAVCHVARGGRQLPPQRHHPDGLHELCYHLSPSASQKVSLSTAWHEVVKVKETARLAMPQKNTAELVLTSARNADDGAQEVKDKSFLLSAVVFYAG